MEYRDFHPEGWVEPVPDVLIAACETCGEVVNIPHQSMPRINSHRPQEARPIKAVQARITRRLEEALDLATVNLGGRTQAVRPAILRFYLERTATSPEVARAVRKAAASPIARKADGGSSTRLSFKLPQMEWDRSWAAATSAGIKTESQLFRGVVVLAASDCRIDVELGEVLRPDGPGGSRERLESLKALVRSRSFPETSDTEAI